MSWKRVCIGGKLVGNAVPDIKLFLILETTYKHRPAAGDSQYCGSGIGILVCNLRRRGHRKVYTQESENL